MNQKQRIQKVIHYLDNHSEITVDRACHLLHASPATIRRDFNVLARDKKFDKVWGGIASSKDVSPDTFASSIAYRQTLYATEKKRIAQKAATYVQDGDVVIIDGGTTTFFMTEQLANKKIKVITNSILIAYHIDKERRSKQGAEVVVTGGLIYPGASILVGPQSITNIKQYHAQWAFLSVGGVEASQTTNSNLLVVETQRAIIEQSEKVIMLADHSKFGKKSMCKLCDIKALDIIISSHCQDNTAIISQIKSSGVEVVEVQQRH